jgi:hypothetical protein
MKGRKKKGEEALGALNEDDGWMKLVISDELMWLWDLPT